MSSLRFLQSEAAHGLGLAASELTVAAVPRCKLVGAGLLRAYAGSRYHRYELIHPIGEGGMGTVWLARMRGEHGFERLVALKVLLPKFARDVRFRNMFIDEARIASRIVHANVAQVVDLGEKDGSLYLVMEWVDGDSLTNLLRDATAQSRAIPLPVLLRVFADLCAGLHAAHEVRDPRGQVLNVVHRDVSPQNILVTDTGAVKVIDFGVVKARGRVAEDTSPGVVKGKLQYMAPERALGAEVDRRADIWSVGAMLYRILGGRAACDSEGNPAPIWTILLRSKLGPLPTSVPPAMVRIVLKALARDPKDRYASAAELQVALENILYRISMGSPTTSGDVAAFVTAVLGSSLAVRRAAIERALGSDDQTATLTFLRPHMALVPSVAKDTAKSAPVLAASQHIKLPPLQGLSVARSPRIEERARAAIGAAPPFSRSVSSLVLRVRQRTWRLPALWPPSALSLVLRSRRCIGDLVVFVAACGLGTLANVLSNHLGSVSAANAGRTATRYAAARAASSARAAFSARSGPTGQLHPRSVPRRQVLQPAFPEPTAVNVDDLALERARVSPSPDRARTAAFWRGGLAARAPDAPSLPFRQSPVPPALQALPSTSALLSGSARAGSSARLEGKPARAHDLAGQPTALAKFADAAKKVDTSRVISAACDPPYVLDWHARKKFRPECF